MSDKSLHTEWDWMGGGRDREEEEHPERQGERVATLDNLGKHFILIGLLRSCAHPRTNDYSPGAGKSPLENPGTT